MVLAQEFLISDLEFPLIKVEILFARKVGSFLLPVFDGLNIDFPYLLGHHFYTSSIDERVDRQHRFGPLNVLLDSSPVEPAIDPSTPSKP